MAMSACSVTAVHVSYSQAEGMPSRAFKVWMRQGVNWLASSRRDEHVSGQGMVKALQPIRSMVLRTVR